MADLKIGTDAYDKAIEDGASPLQAVFAAAVAWDIPVADALDRLLVGTVLELRQYRAGKTNYLRFERT